VTDLVVLGYSLLGDQPYSATVCDVAVAIPARRKAFSAYTKNRPVESKKPPVSRALLLFLSSVYTDPFKHGSVDKPPFRIFCFQPKLFLGAWGAECLTAKAPLPPWLWSMDPPVVDPAQAVCPPSGIKPESFGSILAALGLVKAGQLYESGVSAEADLGLLTELAIRLDLL